MEREDADRKRREEEARAAEELRLQQEEAKRAEEEAEHEREMIAREELPSRSADAMSLDEPSEQEGSGQVAEEQPQQQAETPSEPVFVTVNGQRVDITDTGIDPEFLLALPDDLRMEVINDRRAEMSAESRNNSTGGAAAGGASAGAGAVDSEENDGISQEFLDALPPEIREEVLSQQRLQRQLYERDELMRQRMARTSLTTGDGASAQPGGSSSGATPSSQHPATAAALARVGLTASSRGSRLRAAHLDLPAGLGRSGHASGNQTESAGEEQRVRERRRKKIGSRDITVQLLGKPELAVLTRFIFLPNHGLSNTLIMKVMQYLCENGSTRAHFIQLMLSILSGCALTLADVDKVIQTAIASSPESGAADASGSRPLPRTGSTVSEHQPAGGSGSSAVLGTAAVAQFTASLVQQQNPEFAFPLGDLHADVPAYVPAQRCLDMLHNLAVHNPRASMHFLVEHPQTAKAAAKGDEESRFPLVNLLLLLEKPL
ncbi:E3 ubiquitin-protein ligase tom1, partial [Linderina macrospora]